MEYPIQSYLHWPLPFQADHGHVPRYFFCGDKFSIPTSIGDSFSIDCHCFLNFWSLLSPSYKSSNGCFQVLHILWGNLMNFTRLLCSRRIFVNGSISQVPIRATWLALSIFARSGISPFLLLYIGNVRI